MDVVMEEITTQIKENILSIVVKNLEFISGNNELYVQIIEPLGHKAKEKNEEFLKAYPKWLINLLLNLVGILRDEEINWDSLSEI